MANNEQSREIARFTKKLRDFFQIRTQDEEASDDLAQKTMIKVTRAADSDRTKLNPSYVYRSAINTLINFKRDGSRQPPTVSLDNRGNYDSLPDQRDTENEVSARIHLAEVLSALPSLLRDKEYRAVDLVIMKGLSYKVAGKEMGLKGDAVKDLVFKAREKLRKNFPND